jgi:hypothetical protein
MLLTDSSLLFLAGAVPHYLTEIVALIVRARSSHIQFQAQD